MKNKKASFPVFVMMVLLFLTSCSMGKGDVRARNLEHAVVQYLDSIPGVEYVGMSDVHPLEGNQLHAVVIYYVPDSAGNKVERNSRVVTNYDCSEVYSWDNLETQTLTDVKQKVTDKMNENGIDMDGSLIDALIELKRR